MESGHKGVFARGKYIGKGKGFIFENEISRKGSRRNGYGMLLGGEPTGNIRITELRGPSPFSSITNKGIGDKVHEVIGEDILKRVEGILQDAVNKIHK
jgi:hypothetical protein